MEIPKKTPAKITEQIVNVCEGIRAGQKPYYVPVKPDPNCIEKECVFNAKEKVQKEGGQLQFGWAIYEWPNVWIEAEYHANWISPQNDELGITPKQGDITEILFLPDNTQEYDYSRDYYKVDNRRFPLSDDPNVPKLIRAFEQLFDFEETYSPGRVLMLEGADHEEYERLKRKAASIYHQVKTPSQMLRDRSKPKPKLNASCPCGSGRKYKKCCGKIG